LSTEVTVPTILTMGHAPLRCASRDLPFAIMSATSRPTVDVFIAALSSLYARVRMLASDRQSMILSDDFFAIDRLRA
jgi:hypothetical protein